MTAPESATVTYDVIGVVRSASMRLEGTPAQSTAVEARGRIELDVKYRAALRDLGGCSHVRVVAHLDPGEAASRPIVVPFLDEVGRELLPTRSLRHPNPIAISVLRLLSIENATLHVSGLDLLDGTPVLDLKPYVPPIDCVDAEPTGSLTHRAEPVRTTRSDSRFEPRQIPATEEELLYFLNDPRAYREARPGNATTGTKQPTRRPCVRDVMYARPKTLPRDATVGAVREVFDNGRVRVALLVHDGICAGIIRRTDIPEDAHDDDDAGWFAQAPPTIHADASLGEAHRQLRQTAGGRLVVIDDRKRLQGLLCHNHQGTGFCNHKSRCGRPVSPQAKKAHWTIIRVIDSTQRQRDLLLATRGKSINLGDLLTLPPNTRTRWLVIDARDEPLRANHGIATVEPFEGTGTQVPSRTLAPSINMDDVFRSCLECGAGFGDAHWPGCTGRQRSNNTVERGIIDELFANTPRLGDRRLPGEAPRPDWPYEPGAHLARAANRVGRGATAPNGAEPPRES